MSCLQVVVKIRYSGKAFSVKSYRSWGLKLNDKLVSDESGCTLVHCNIGRGPVSLTEEASKLVLIDHDCAGTWNGNQFKQPSGRNSPPGTDGYT